MIIPPNIPLLHPGKLKAPIKRRRFLRGLLQGGLVTVGLPWLELFAGRKAHAESGFPSRFLLFFWGNGNRPDLWTPTGEGSGDSWQLSESLQPLAAFKQKLSIVTGYSTKVPNLYPHNSGLAGLISGSAAIGSEENWTLPNASIDQHIAAAIGGDTVYRSLVLGCVASESVSWNGPYSRNPIESDPFAFYEWIFGSTFRAPGEEGIVDPSLGYRRSVLDSVSEDIAALKNQIGVADQIRLEQHLDGVRELELRLARLEEDPPSLESCARPDPPSGSYEDIDSRPQFNARSRIMSKLMAMALACDQTRVISYTFTKALNNNLFPDASDGHHNLTHHEPGSQPEVGAITHFTMEQLAILLAEMDAIPEGDGTLLDHSIVFATSEVSEGRTHSLDEIPIVVAGSGNGRLGQNLHLRSYTQENVNKLNLSLIRAMGINQPSWGSEESLTSESLTALEV